MGISLTSLHGLNILVVGLKLILRKESKMSSKSKTAGFPILGILGLIFVTFEPFDESKLK
jgi:hypothetical protein